MNRELQSFLNGLLRAGALAVLVLMGFELSSQSTFAQATYFYTGNDYTVVSGSFTTSMSVTATLELPTWLPPNQSCLNVIALPGFRLIMNDGIQTWDSIQGFANLNAYVSTDALGHIVAPWRVGLGGVESIWQVLPNTVEFNPNCYAPAISGPLDFDRAGAAESLTPGSWSYPAASALATMLQNDVNLQRIGPGKSLSDQLGKIENDITTSNGYACSDLSVFADEVNAQSGKKITAAQSTFILQTVGVMQSELGCGS